MIRFLRFSNSTVRPSDSVSQVDSVPAQRGLRRTTRRLIGWVAVPVIPYYNPYAYYDPYANYDAYATMCAGCAASRGLPHHGGMNTYARCSGCNSAHHIG